MKRFFVAVMMIATLVGPAFAEHIELYQAAGFGALKQFYGVPNNARPTATINISESSTYTNIQVYINDVQFASPTGGGAGDNVNVVCTNVNGSGDSIVLNAHFSTYRTYVGSGRGQHWVTHYTLESGSIDRADQSIPPNEPPTVSLTSPGDGDTVTKNITVSATAQDDYIVASVVLTVDGSPLAELTSAPYSVDWDTRAVADGPHTLIAYAYDTDGAVGVSAPVNVTVDNSAPEITSTAPTDDVELGSTFQYTVTASGTPAPTYSLDYYYPGMAINPSTGVLTWVTSPDYQGSNWVTVIASNNSGADYQGFYINVVDTTAPAAPANFRAATITTSAVTLAWSAAADLSGVAGYRVYELVSGAWVLKKDGLTTTTVKISNLKSKSKHTYAVTAFDNWYNESARSAQLVVTLK